MRAASGSIGLHALDGVTHNRAMHRVRRLATSMLIVLALAAPASAAALRAAATLPRATPATVCGGVLDGPRGELTSVRMADGVSLVEYGGGVGTTATIRAFSPACTPDTEFGKDGTVTVRFPHPLDGWSQLVLRAVTGGKVVLFGATARNWMGTELSAAGATVKAFGTDGWVSIHPKARGSLVGIAQVSAITQEPNGTILVGGAAGEPLCCTYTVVYALHPDGAVDHGYGTDGFVHVMPAPSHSSW